MICIRKFMMTSPRSGPIMQTHYFDGSFPWIPDVSVGCQIWMTRVKFELSSKSFSELFCHLILSTMVSQVFFSFKKNAECFYLTTETCNSVIQSFAAIGEFICFWPQMVFCLNKARDCIYVDIGSFVSVKGPYIFEFIVYFWFFVQDH